MCFINGGDEQHFIGSADWMSRNLKHRVEVVTPVSDPESKRYLKEVLLKTYLRDNIKAAELRPDGSYVRVDRHGQDEFDAQMYFARPEAAFRQTAAEASR
jgi:polyphosphate kinase